MSTATYRRKILFWLMFTEGKTISWWCQAWCLEQEIGEFIFFFNLQTQSRESKPEVGPGYELSQTLPTEYFLQQDWTISPNSATNWGLSFQIREPMGNILIQATIHKYPFMYIHVGTHVVLWIHRNAIINAIASKSFICDSSRDSFGFLSLFFTGYTKIETLS